jgi:hypothetical protein
MKQLRTVRCVHQKPGSSEIVTGRLLISLHSRFRPFRLRRRSCRKLCVRVSDSARDPVNPASA